MTTTTNNQTAGTIVGRALGATVAHTGHFMAVALTATGRFGADVASGASAGYTETAAIRAQEREIRAAMRKAQGQVQHSPAVFDVELAQ